MDHPVCSPPDTHFLDVTNELLDLIQELLAKDGNSHLLKLRLVSKNLAKLVASYIYTIIVDHEAILADASARPPQAFNKASCITIRSKGQDVYLSDAILELIKELDTRFTELQLHGIEMCDNDAERLSRAIAGCHVDLQQLIVKPPSQCLENAFAASDVDTILAAHPTLLHVDLGIRPSAAVWKPVLPAGIKTLRLFGAKDKPCRGQIIKTATVAMQSLCHCCKALQHLCLDNIILANGDTPHTELIMAIKAGLPSLQSLELAGSTWSGIANVTVAQLICSAAGIPDLKLQVPECRSRGSWPAQPYLLPESLHTIAAAAADAGVRSLSLMPPRQGSLSADRMYVGHVRHLVTGAAPSLTRLELALQGLSTEEFFRRVMQKHGVEVVEVRVWEPATAGLHVTLRCGQQVTEVVSL